MVYAWGLWKTRHERLREQLYREFREKYGPELREELRQEFREKYWPKLEAELLEELHQWFQEGRSWEEWLNRESQGNGSKPAKP